MLITTLENLTLGRKLLLGFGGGVALMTALGLSASFNLHKVNNAAQQLYQRELQTISSIRSAQVYLAKAGREMRQALLAADTQARNEAANLETLALANLQRALRDARSTGIHPEVATVLDAFEGNLSVYAHNLETATVLFSTDPVAASAFISSKEYRDVPALMDQQLEQAVSLSDRYAQISADDAASTADRSERLVYWLLGGSILTSIVLGQLIARSIRGPAEHLQSALSELASGQLDVRVPHTTASNEFGALARSIVVLQSSAQNIARQHWVKAQLGTITANLQQATSQESLADVLLSLLAPLLELGQGSFYLHNKASHTLRRVGSYGLTKVGVQRNEFPISEGLVGQCARDQKPIQLDHPPTNYITIGSGLGEAPAHFIWLLPVQLQKNLVGVLELASFQPFNERSTSLLEELLPLLAMSVEILHNNLNTQQLLSETREQAAHMERQAAQLEEQQVELEAQQVELKATESWFRGIVESAPEALLVVDESGLITLCNTRADAIFGFDAGELAGHNVDELVPAALRAHHPALRASFLLEKTTRPMGTNLDLRAVRKNGELFPVEVSGQCCRHLAVTRAQSALTYAISLIAS